MNVTTVPKSANNAFEWPFLALAIWIFLLLIAGGASRADVVGQAIVRSAAIGFIILAIVFGSARSMAIYRAPLLFLGSIWLLVLSQLIPLPLGFWIKLPGHEFFNMPLGKPYAGLSWRPLTLFPGGTINALLSLLSPTATLLLLSQLTPAAKMKVPGLILIAIFLSSLVGLMQISGLYIDNPTINDSPGEISGVFANRNHFALFLAVGCLVTPAWIFQRRRVQQRLVVGLMLMVLFALMILASGSRVGLVLLLVGCIIGILLVRKQFLHLRQYYPRWVPVIIVCAVLVTSAGLLVASIMADRAVSITRTLALDPGEDIRSLSLPTTLGMVREYFPIGSGFGSFDAVFRMHEPSALLKRTYLNHAHNDFVEIILEGGMLGLAILVATLAWWATRCVRQWRARFPSSERRPQIGGAIVLLVALASIFDYPARTPTIMALIAIASTWLCERADLTMTSPLPRYDHDL